MRFRRTPTEHFDGYRHSPAVTIRWATAADARGLQDLAELDESRVPPAPVLLAFVGDELWAAASLSTGAVIGDPFRPSAEVAELVLERGRQLTVAQGATTARTRFGRPTTAVSGLP